MDSARVAHRFSKLLFVYFVECNPMRHSGVNPARPDDAVRDPVIDNLITGSKPVRHLAHCQLLGPLEFGGRDPVLATDPLNDFYCIGLAFGTRMALSIELICDLAIRQIASQCSDPVDNRSRIPHPVCDVGRELHGHVRCWRHPASGCEPEVAFDWPASQP